MAKGSDSKGKTLAAAVKLFRQQGYHGAALNDVLAAGGSPRGSLYFHFPGGKEEIGGAALTLAGEAVRQAIAQALAFAGIDDTVVIAGKGHEQGQEFEDGRKIPFDDREVAREELRKL